MMAPVAPLLTLSSLIESKHRLETLRGLTPDRIIDEMLESLGGRKGFGAETIVQMRRAILAREQEATTGIGNRVAIPHMKGCTHVQQICGAFGRSTHGVNWSATDGEPVRLFFLILSPPGAEGLHVRAMKKIVHLSRDRKTLDYLIQTPALKNLEAIFQEVDAQTT
ncbi:MAG: PTS sugar transporter subunit IIA [Planctomycetota bacterium]